MVASHSPVATFPGTRLQRVAAVVLEALVGAVQQAGRHGPAVVGGAEHLVQRGLQHRRQALAAVLGRAGQRRPAGLPEGLVGVPKPRCHGDAACFKARADLIPIPVQGRDHLADELAGLVEHLAHQVRVHLGEGAQGLQLGGRLQNICQDEGHVIGAGLVRVHVANRCWLPGGMAWAFSRMWRPAPCPGRPQRQEKLAASSSEPLPA
jgi:hypothetical protein